MTLQGLPFHSQITTDMVLHVDPPPISIIFATCVTAWVVLQLLWRLAADAAPYSEHVEAPVERAVWRSSGSSEFSPSDSELSKTGSDTTSEHDTRWSYQTSEDLDSSDRDSDS